MKVLSVLFALVALGSAQPHHGPDDPHAAEIDCYNCDGHHHGLPSCLDSVHKCHHDQVCVATYHSSTGAQPTIKCAPKHECDDAVKHSQGTCSDGGYNVTAAAGHHGPGHHDDTGSSCMKCCTDTACVADVANILKIEVDTSANLKCPGYCQVDDLDTCVKFAKVCGQDQYCKVTQDHNEIEGQCKDDHDYNHCMDETRRHPDCLNHDGKPEPHCTLDCCTTTDCINKRFGVVNNATTLWQRLHGDCRDELAGDACNNLKQTQDVCHSRLALDICPMTCGLCALNISCADTVVNNGCADLKVTKDICNDPMAVFICPATCNKCDELLNSVITGIIDGGSNATAVPASLLPSTVSPSAFPTFDCTQLDTSDCTSLKTVCASSFINVVCPTQCAACASA